MNDSIKVTRLGYFQNGSFGLRNGNHTDSLCYWLVECPAMREAVAGTIDSGARNPWIYISRKEAREAAEREAKAKGSGARNAR